MSIRPGEFGELHYPAAAITAEGLQPGRLLGFDEIGQRYVVEQCFLEKDRTVVVLRYATVADVKAPGVGAL